MAVRNALMPFRLPEAADVGNLTSPLMAGLQTYRQGMADNFDGDRALAREDMAKQQLQLSKNADSRSAESHEVTLDKARVDRLSGLAQMIDGVQDPTQRQAMWGKVTADPKMRASISKYMDPNDFNAGPKFLLAQARGYVDPLDERRKRAEIAGVEGNNAMQPLRRQGLELDIETKRKALVEPKIGTADLGPDHTRVFYDPRTGARIGEPLEGKPKSPDATTRKAIYEAQDELPNLKGAIDNLLEAKGLLPQIYTGYGAGIRSSFNQAAPGMLPNVITDPKRAQATQRYNQIMTTEAVGAMSQTLKGATTDNEMRQFVNLINDQSVGPEVKAKAIDAMLIKARAFERNKRDRIKELGGRMPDDGTSATQEGWSARRLD